jgi:hypothetical protein
VPSQNLRFIAGLNNTGLKIIKNVIVDIGLKVVRGWESRKEKARIEKWLK